MFISHFGSVTGAGGNAKAGLTPYGLGREWDLQIRKMRRILRIVKANVTFLRRSWDEHCRDSPGQTRGGR